MANRCITEIKDNSVIIDLVKKWISKIIETIHSYSNHILFICVRRR